MMKEYKYKINGNVYKVAIGDIEDNIAHVEVNGTPYKVEMEKAPKAVVKPVVRPVSTSPAPAPATVVKPAATSTGKSGVKSPLPGVILDIKVNVGDVKIELLEPTSPESTIAKFIEKNNGNGGMHHLAFAVEDGVANAVLLILQPRRKKKG
jgi:hypothetical protein